MSQLNKFLISLITICIFCSCVFQNNKKETSIEATKKLLLNTDNNFALFSLQNGMKAAFLEYIDSNAVLLRPNAFPIIGANAVDYLIQLKDEDYKMTWSPNAAMVAVSGELGYTYGTYHITLSKKDSILSGTYISIWKKNSENKWKVVLDSGNEGLGDKNESE